MTVGKKYICVLQRGWVIVGKVISANTREVVLGGAATLMGTSADLGALALRGPSVNASSMYPCGTVRFHPLTACFYVDCDPGAWGE